MNKQLLKDSFGWGIILWLIGYVLGIILIFIFPSEIIGWILMPIGIVITLFVLSRIKSKDIKYYLILSIVWTAIAVIFDYFFIVKAFNSNTYYKLDVYLYYIFTFTLPIIVSFFKRKKK